jgi:signal transduction histidine kinase
VRHISHEMRTPMNTVVVGIRLLTESLARKGIPLNDDCFEIITDIRTSCDNALRRLNDILSYDKLKQGIYLIEKERITAAELITTSVASFFLLVNYS